MVIWSYDVLTVYYDNSDCQYQIISLGLEIVRSPGDKANDLKKKSPGTKPRPFRQIFSCFIDGKLHNFEKKRLKTVLDLPK